jgi:hypothetical protein
MQKCLQWFSFCTSQCVVYCDEQLVSFATKLGVPEVVQFLHDVVEAVNDALLFWFKAAGVF